MDKLPFNEADRIIRQASKILLVTHNNPDGDGISSVCAMAEYLKTIGKDFSLFCHNEIPRQFHFLFFARDFSYRLGSDNSENPGFRMGFALYDLILVFDCGSLKRTMLEAEIRGRHGGQKVIEFDHHPKVDDYADLEIRNDGAAATAELIYGFFTANKIRIAKPMADAILTGILTDTGNFLYPSTSDKSVKIASEMLIYGANLPKIIENTWKNKSMEIMKLWGRVMSNLKINRRHEIAVTVVRENDLKEFSVNDDELEGIAGFLSNLKGVKAVLFLREKDPHTLKGSLRSSDKQTDVSKLAKLLGGGGHPKASGFTIEGKIVETEEGWRVI